MALAAIYVGRGTSALSIRGARAMLEERGLEVIMVTAKELPKTLQEPNCRLLVTNLDTTSKVEVGIQVMPGGRDRPYQASLGDEGARRIRWLPPFRIKAYPSPETEGSLWSRGDPTLVSAQVPNILSFFSSE